MVVEGENAAVSRKIIGNKCEAAPGTIRGDYGLNLGRNIIHGSDSTESAQREVKLWFTSSEIADYKEPREDYTNNKNIK